MVGLNNFNPTISFFYKIFKILNLFNINLLWSCALVHDISVYQ